MSRVLDASSYRKCRMSDEGMGCQWSAAASSCVRSSAGADGGVVSLKLPGAASRVDGVLVPSEFVSSLAQLDNASSAKAAIATKFVFTSSPGVAVRSSRALRSDSSSFGVLMKRTRHFLSRFLQGSNGTATEENALPAYSSAATWLRASRPYSDYCDYSETRVRDGAAHPGHDF